MKLLSTALCLLSAIALQAAPSIQDIPLKDIDGKDTSLKAYSGKVQLVVNVASQCGLYPSACDVVGRRWSMWHRSAA